MTMRRQRPIRALQQQRQLRPMNMKKKNGPLPMAGSGPFQPRLPSVITGAGFALLLAGISLLTGVPITPKNGLIWGICGFLAVTVAPGAGLAPELPGMPAGDLVSRQVWWVGTIIATGIGIFLIATRRELIWLAAAVVLIALPHIIGAPQPPTHETAVPAGLAASFAANTIAASAVLWSLIGLFLGLALQKFGKDVYAS